MNLSHQSAKAIFLKAVQDHDPQDWPSLLDEECGDNAVLRRHVEALLHAHQQHDSLFDGGPTPVYERLAGIGDVIDRYKLLEQIGEGGFGVVFVADQQEPIRRHVALKIVKPGMSTREVIARFEAERQTLAVLDHPNIARVLDGGATASGLPYFVMELVRGKPITDYCDANRLTTRERLQLFAAVCGAIHHAHRKGIIHRDVKPTNVLITMQEGVATPKVIDFGVAKALDRRLDEHSVYTRFGEMVGTPLYMSPEQAGMSASDVDTRTDVYSLGVLLYELLTGTTPFDRERIKQAAVDEIRRVIREEEPLAPSLKLSALGDSAADASTSRHATPRQLSALLRGELDWIVLKALEKDRSRRYDGADEFGEDVQRFLNNDAVVACPPSKLYQLRKYVKKHWVRLATAGTVALALLTAAVFAGLAYATSRRAQLERQVIEVDLKAREALAADDLESARDRLAKLAELRRLAYGEQSQWTLQAQAGLADVLGRLTQYQEASELYRTVLAGQVHLLGQEHPDTKATIDRVFSLDIEAWDHYWELGDDSSLKQAIEHSRHAVDLSEQFELDRQLRPRDRRVGGAYTRLVAALFEAEEFEQCHDVANHLVGLPIIVTDYSLFLHMALLDWREGRRELAKDWISAAEQMWIGGGGWWRVRLRPLRDEAFKTIYGSADTLLPQQSTTEQEAVYTRLLVSYPQAMGIRQKRGYCRVQLGLWDDAAEDFAHAVDQVQPDGNTYLHASHAFLSLHRNNLQEYQSRCAWMMQRLVDRRFQVDQRRIAVISCAVSPSANVDYNALYKLAQAEPLAAGLAAYRCGDYKLALDLLKPKADDTHLPLRRLFEGMALQRLGEHAHAKDKLAEARRLIDEHSPRPGRPREDPNVSYFTSVIWCEALAVLNEAESLIERGEELIER